MILAILTIGVSCGAFSAYVANAKCRNGLIWFLLGFLFGPLALIAIAVTPADTDGQRRAASVARGDTAITRCRICGETGSSKFFTDGKCRACQ
jgi:hypothetical protein